MNPDLRHEILGWINIGPLGTIEGREQHMQRTVEALGEQSVDMFLDLLADAEASGEDEAFIDTVVEFGEHYAARFPKAMAAAGMKRLSKDGPAGIITVLASTGERALVPMLLEAIDPRGGSLDVALALVDCLAALGGTTAREALLDLQRDDSLHPELAAEIELLLQTIRA